MQKLQRQRKRKQKQLKRQKPNHKEYNNRKQTHYKSESENENLDQNSNNDDYVDHKYNDEQEYFSAEENDMELLHKPVEKIKKNKSKEQ